MKYDLEELINETYKNKQEPPEYLCSEKNGGTCYEEKTKN